MGKRALFIVPDSGSSHYHLGEVATNGCYGRVPIFWFFPMLAVAFVEAA